MQSFKTEKKFSTRFIPHKVNLRGKKNAISTLQEQKSSGSNFSPLAAQLKEKGTSHSI